MTIFAKIIDKEIPADIVFEDDAVLAFRDISPQAPVHILVIPKKPIPKLAEVGASDEALLGTLMLRVAEIAAQEGLENYRVIINNGAGAGQTVFHLHVHILSGRPLNWPPG